MRKLYLGFRVALSDSSRKLSLDLKQTNIGAFREQGTFRKRLKKFLLFLRKKRRLQGT